MKNRLIDLNNHMFAQLERLSDEDISEEKLISEISRSKAITVLAGQIIGNARLALDGTIAIQENLLKKPPQMLGAPGYEDED